MRKKHKKNIFLNILIYAKGRYVVVLDIQDYINKAQTLLSDTSTFRVLD